MSQNGVQAVLVVGDFSALAELVSDALARKGVAALRATSPDRGLELFHEHRQRIGLTVIDMVKPTRANLDLASELERLQPGVLTLHLVGAGNTVAGYGLRAQSLARELAVPFTETQFISRIESLLEIDSAARQMPDEQLWQRLAADSDRFSPGTTMLYIYERGQAALAAIHVNLLMAGRVRYAFQPTNYEDAPYSLIVRAPDVTKARRLLAQVWVGGQPVSAAWALSVD